jgi:putative DNA primase/helicase
VRGFIGQHGGGRFEPLSGRAEPDFRKVNNRAGFYSDDGDGGREWLILPAAWVELWAGAGLDPKQAARHLAAANVLRREGQAHSVSMRLPDLARQRVYAVTLPDESAEHVEHVAQGEGVPAEKPRKTRF